MEEFDQPTKRTGVHLSTVFTGACRRTAAGINILQMCTAAVTVSFAVRRSVSERCRFTAFFDNCSAAIADRITGVTLCGAICIHLVFQRCTVGSVVRLIGGNRFCRNRVVANGAFPMLAAGFFAGGCFVDDPYDGRVV